jgi:putative ABC transport system substrate-binding protein
MPVIGYLSPYARDGFAQQLLAAFRRGLAESGHVEGRNVIVEYRWAEDRYDRLPALAADLVARKVTVIYAQGGPVAVVAKAATTTIPVVFSTGADAVASGLVDSLGRQSGNLTGVAHLSTTLEPKRLGLLRELVPQADTVGILLNPNLPLAVSQSSDLEAAARTLGLKLHVLRASTDREIDSAFEAVAQHRIPGLLVAADPFFFARIDKLVGLASHYKIPTIYPWREFAAAGGLMSYGINIAEAIRQCGAYVGQILKGARLADLPIVQPTKFELVINLKTAKALGLTISSALLAEASEIIE